MNQNPPGGSISRLRTMLGLTSASSISNREDGAQILRFPNADTRLLKVERGGGSDGGIGSSPTSVSNHGDMAMVSSVVLLQILKKGTGTIIVN
jgi:hypothetical protein